MSSTTHALNQPTHHILSVLVQNRPGVLARVAGLFARRGYNIFSLAVAPTEDPDFSRITIVVDVESTPLEQVVKQLFKLIEVVRITELDPRKSVERELMMCTVNPRPINSPMLMTTVATATSIGAMTSCGLRKNQSMRMKIIRPASGAEIPICTNISWPNVSSATGSPVM